MVWRGQGGIQTAQPSLQDHTGSMQHSGEKLAGLREKAGAVCGANEDMVDLHAGREPPPEAHYTSLLRGHQDFAWCLLESRVSKTLKKG